MGNVTKQASTHFSIVKRSKGQPAVEKAYSDYEPYKAMHDMSKSLSSLKKLKYDKEHEKLRDI